MTCEAEVDGRRCEEMVEEICVSLGYRVQISASQNSKWDLVVNGLRVQVKKRSSRRSRGRIVELKTSARGKDFAYGPGEVDAFVILLDGRWLVVPSGAISSDDGSVPNMIPHRKIEPFVDAWHLLNGGTHITERQLGFDF